MASKIPTLSFAESLRAKGLLLAPNLLQGLFVRSPTGVRLTAAAGTERRAHTLLAELERRHAGGVMLLRGGKELLLVAPAAVRQVLDASPDPWGPPAAKKKGMGHFQPGAVTISTGADWTRRRRFNEQVLETGRMHRLAGSFLEVVEDEVGTAAGGETLDWPRLEAVFDRIMLQVVFGRPAAGDGQLSAALGKLMRQGNRLVLLRRSQTFEVLHDGIRRHLASPHPGSLMEVAAALEPDDGVQPGSQVPHWMFAMGGTLAANVARALAAVAVSPEVEARLRAELASGDPGSPEGVAGLAVTAGCLQEAMRLWPTTPMLVREAQREVEFEGVSLPAGAKALIPNLYNHRSGIESPHRLMPERWPAAAADYRFNFFSSGPQVCAGIDLALVLGVAALARLLSGAPWTLDSPRLPAEGPLPLAFDHHRLRLRRRPAG